MNLGLICVDTLKYNKSIFAINKTLDCVDISEVYWISDIPYPEKLSIPVINIQISKIKNYLIEYNTLFLNDLPKILPVNSNNITHYLTIHADGFAVNKNSWTDEFLDYDYIGAVWPWHQYNRVGNGGFSLRSKFFFECVDKLNQDEKNKQIPYNGEDHILCRIFNAELQEMGVNYAPEELADQFSIEANLSSKWLGKSFGFHGMHCSHAYGYNYEELK